MKAVILLGHGSRDPQWREPMDAVARRIAAQGVQVQCAFIELQEPDLLAAARELASRGATRISVFPIFLGIGKHMREDLPLRIEAVRHALPGIAFDQLAPAGEDPRLLDLLAGIALASS